MPIVQQSPDFASNPGLLKRLIYSKYLLNRARLLQQEGNELASAQAILTAHDSIEMLIRVIVDFVNAKQHQQFMKQLEFIEEKTGKQPPYTSAMDRLNSLRVNFKHKGNIPHPSDVAELMPVVAAFCSDATSQYLALDYQKVSLADLIQNAEAREKVKDAEMALAEGKIPDSLLALGIAFDKLQAEARKSRASGLIQQSYWGRVDRHNQLMKPVQQSIDTVNMLILGIDPAKFRLFSELTPSRAYAMSGRMQVQWRPNTKMLGLNEYEFCHHFVIDFALRLASPR